MRPATRQIPCNGISIPYQRSTAKRDFLATTCRSPKGVACLQDVLEERERFATGPVPRLFCWLRWRCPSQHAARPAGCCTALAAHGRPAMLFERTRATPDWPDTHGTRGVYPGRGIGGTTSKGGVRCGKPSRKWRGTALKAAVRVNCAHDSALIRSRIRTHIQA